MKTKQINNADNNCCGFIAIIGKSNVGKSTLLNNLIGEKISITADRPQTTRNKILGIKTVDNKQAIYIDTPGISLNNQSKLNKLMNKTAKASFKDVDLIIFMVDGLNWDEADEAVLKSILKLVNPPPVFLLLNKIDLIKDQKLLLLQVQKLTDQYNFTEVFPIAASKNINLNILEKSIFNILPTSHHYFFNSDITDKDLNFRIAEIIREKLIKNLSQELPYTTHVQVNSIEKPQTTYRIDATIWVEKLGQKKIVIGENGSKLKIIGTQARIDLEKLLKNKVFLALFVQVKSNWTNDQNNLKTLNI